MDRREAIKIMGASLSSAALFALAPDTLSAMDRWRSPSRKRIVFYFTATGNSLFIAKAFSENPKSIPQEIKKGQPVYEADEIGFVFPDYASSAPLIVRDFIKKATFKAPYIFSIITYGNSAGNVSEWWNNYSREFGVNHSFIRTILMVDNYLPVFDMDEQIQIEKHVDENLACLVDGVGHRHICIEASESGFFNKEMLRYMQDQHFSRSAEQLFILDSGSCSRCMVCAKICPHMNFSLAEGEVVFSGKCEHCLACVHACPHKALSLKNGESNRLARYRNPHISQTEIIYSNTQLTSETV